MSESNKMEFGKEYLSKNNEYLGFYIYSKKIPIPQGYKGTPFNNDHNYYQNKIILCFNDIFDIEFSHEHKVRIKEFEINILTKNLNNQTPPKPDNLIEIKNSNNKYSKKKLIGPARKKILEKDNISTDEYNFLKDEEKEFYVENKLLFKGNSYFKKEIYEIMKDNYNAKIKKNKEKVKILQNNILIKPEITQIEYNKLSNKQRNLYNKKTFSITNKIYKKKVI